MSNHRQAPAGADAVAGVKRRLNCYLFHELGIDGEAGQIGEAWPFSLREICTAEDVIEGTKIFEFQQGGSRYFAQAGSTCAFWLADGITVEDLRRHMAGEQWIAEHEGVDLGTSRPGDERLPLASERRRAIEEIARGSLPCGGRIEVLEGIYFPANGCYLALVEDCDDECSFLVGSNIAPRQVKHATIAPWRRLAIAVGQMLLEGELNDEDMETGR